MSTLSARPPTPTETWESGDYSKPAQFVLPVGPVLTERAGIESGMEVLDVATGTGNVALPAAAAGARVIGLDIAPALLGVGRARAARQGLPVEWVEGDAEDMPFEDGRFDRVLSAFGVQFVPHHRAAAEELSRVCRRGGILALASWTPRGFIGRFLKTVAGYLPAPPEGVLPPPLWGDEEYVERVFAGTGVALRFDRARVDFTQESPAAFVDFMATWYGPLVQARERLSDDSGWEGLRSDLVALCREASLSGDDGFLAPSEYLIATGRKSG